jgi:hypothetical protein
MMKKQREREGRERERGAREREARERGKREKGRTNTHVSLTLFKIIMVSPSAEVLSTVSLTLHVNCDSLTAGQKRHTFICNF